VVRAIVSPRDTAEVTGFLGPTARQRALEYAGEKYAGVQLLERPPV
jgi:hypothetical protein